MPSHGWTRLLATIGIAVLILAGTAEAGQAGQAGVVRAALPPSSTAEEIGPAARAPAAWVDFCKRYPADCSVDTSEPETVVLTPAIWHLILGINRNVNATITPMSDLDHWGVLDSWDYPDDGKGDCEDYALLKRKLLGNAGLPRRAMLMTVVLDEAGEGHAVLTVRTDRGDFILDNKRNQVLPWVATGYAYLKRESQDVTGWVSLGPASPATVTATTPQTRP